LIALCCDQPLPTIQPQERLTEDLRIDSLAMAALLLDIEDAFGVVIDADALSRIETVADMEKAVRDLVAAVHP
jgi:acyl carrier protein